jgi:hypothetical protein
MANNVTLPKRTTIEGMPHKLAYITPQEGDLLKRMGGSGQMHRGVPSYRPAGDTGATAAGSSGGTGASVGAAAGGAGSIGGSSISGDGRGLAADVAAAQAVAQAQQAIAQAEAQAAQQAAVEGYIGKAASHQLANIAFNNALQQAQMVQSTPLGFIMGKLSGQTPEQAALAQAVSLMGMPNVGLSPSGRVTAPIGTAGSITQGKFGVTYSGMPQAGYTGAFSNLVNPPSAPDGREPPVQVAPIVDEEGRARCPTGYYFNETLQACIMDTRSTSPFQPTAPTAQPTPSSDYYARMGLLDQPPSGLLEAGFGTPQDFAAANTAFRSGAATRPSMYTDPYNLQGYTLLS